MLALCFGQLNAEDPQNDVLDDVGIVLGGQRSKDVNVIWLSE